MHSREGVSYDWLDGVLLFQVVSQNPMDGVATLTPNQVRKFNLELDDKSEVMVRWQAPLAPFHCQLAIDDCPICPIAGVANRHSAIARLA